MTSADGQSDEGSLANRVSLRSNLAVQQGSSNRQDNDIAPPSRGTEFTDPDDRGTVNVSQIENTIVRSIEESERPLQNQTLKGRINHSTLGQNYKQDADGPPSLHKSPTSFQANVLVPAQGNAPELHGKHERKQFSSSDKPTFSTTTTSPKHAAPKSGINYQYFAGNTAFCWGGRFQNARDRPVNIATGIIVVVPSILFLIYS